MTAQAIHCRANGTIDTDFYRARATRERKIVLRLAARRFIRAIRKVASAIVTWLTPPPRPLPDPGALMLIAGAAARRPKI